MTEILTAANIINNALLFDDIGETFRTARARRDQANEVAHLRAWLDFYEERHRALIAKLQPNLEAAKAQALEQERRIAQLERENAELRRQNGELEDAKNTAKASALDKGLQLAHWNLYGRPRPPGSSF
jgi:hypothetical protein